jgi:hypothetical protein
MTTSGEQLHYDIAKYEHHVGIEEVYRSAMISPTLYTGLISDDPNTRNAALHQINTSGGFISPPDQNEMPLAQQYGKTAICLSGDQVVGFNRVVFEPVKVKAFFCKEFLLDSGQNFENAADLPDWQGNRELAPRKFLKRVYWVDREAAHSAWQATSPSSDIRFSSTLVWAIDGAVHPKFHRRGIASTLKNRIKERYPAGTSCVAFRIFELRAVNNVAITVQNNPSLGLYTDQDTSLYAWTEEDIIVAEGITLTVRWNQWLRHYPSSIGIR